VAVAVTVAVSTAGHVIRPGIAEAGGNGNSANVIERGLMPTKCKWAVEGACV